MSTSILKTFPGTRYYPGELLVTWHPRGIFDGDLADRILAFIETEERIMELPFNRYADFGGLTEIRLKVGHAFQIAERRRAGYHGDGPVKSAFFCEHVAGFGIARLYEALMEGAPIHVRAFRTRKAAAEWLGVSANILTPEETGEDDVSNEKADSL